MTDSRAARAQAQVDAWNSTYPVGIVVSLLRKDGSTVQTRTRGEAHALYGYMAVIWLEGVSGCCLLDQVRPLPESAS